MERPSAWMRIAAVGLVAGVLGTGSGCLGCLHPVEAPPTEIITACHELPACCRNHVYVFLINGLDPVNYGDLTGLRDYIQGLGFHRTYYGQIYHYWQFRSEIRRLHREDPDARFVLIGFSVGVNLAFSMADGVRDDGVLIDLLVLLSGNHPVWPMPHEPPANVGRIVNVLASGLMKDFGEREWAENMRIPDTRHFDVPTDAETLRVLARELPAVAVQVTAPAEMPPPPAPEQAPTPRPATVRPGGAWGGYDFLKPVSRLKPPPPPPGPPQPAPAPAPERVAVR